MRRRKADQKWKCQKRIATHDAYRVMMPTELLSGLECRRPGWFLDMKYQTCWDIKRLFSIIPTYRVYQLYDITSGNCTPIAGESWPKVVLSPCDYLGKIMLGLHQLTHTEYQVATALPGASLPSWQWSQNLWGPLLWAVLPAKIEASAQADRMTKALITPASRWTSDPKLYAWVRGHLMLYAIVSIDTYGTQISLLWSNQPRP